MHTYIKSKDEPLWTVGHYKNVVLEVSIGVASESEWVPMKDFAREEDAAEYVSYLNGGRRP